MSLQKEVFSPPTPFRNQPLPLRHPPSRISHKSFHHTENNLPPLVTYPLLVPYSAANTLNHNPPLSTYRRQHYLPNKAKLNSLILLTPNPPYSLLEHTLSQFIQWILQASSLPHKNDLKRDSMIKIIPTEALKKEKNKLAMLTKHIWWAQTDRPWIGYSYTYTHVKIINAQFVMYKSVLFLKA